jgi:hypothetical protein
MYLGAGLWCENKYGYAHVSKTMEFQIYLIFVEWRPVVVEK